MRIKIISPSDKIEYDVKNKKYYSKYGINWADHYIKIDLQEEFKKRGYEIIEDFNVMADIDILISGNFINHAKLLTAKTKFNWFYNNSYCILYGDFKDFLQLIDHFFIASVEFENVFKNNFKKSCSVLLGGSSKKLFRRNSKPAYDVVFIGNSSRPSRVEVIKHLVATRKYRIALVGNWYKIVQPKDRKNTALFGEFYPNHKYNIFYNNGYTTFYSGHQDMKINGFIPTRHFDVYSCSECLLIAEENIGLKHISTNIPTFKDVHELEMKIDYYLANQKDALALSENCRRDIKRFTWDKVVDNIEKVIHATT